MKKTLVGLSIVASMLAASSYEVGIAGGRSVSITNSPIPHYNFLNLRGAKQLKENTKLRVEYEISEELGKSSLRLHRALVNYEYDFKNIDIKYVMPYAFGGAGFQLVEGDYDDNIIADAGLGLKANIKDNFAAFVEYRVLRDFGNNDNHISWLLGIDYKFSSLKKATEDVKEAVDSDGDGVLDIDDKCPDTPKGVKVDSNGCPVDSDKDGVVDYLDKCPNTPAGVKVDKNGCAIDSDGDGVPDYLDKCPNTPKDLNVNAQGCPVSFNFKINFDVNSAEIKPEYLPRLKEFANFLKENPAYKAVIEGYTDNTGNAEYNQKLSEERAKAVYDALIKLGISKDRLSYKGYGAANPVASNDTAEGRAQNRRLVAKLYIEN